MGSVVGDVWHGLEQADPTGIATKINNAAQGVWDKNAAHGTEPDFSKQQPQQNPYFNQQPTLNLPPDATYGQTGQGTGKPVQQGGWVYVPGQGPVWQGGGGNRA